MVINFTLPKKLYSQNGNEESSKGNSFFTTKKGKEYLGPISMLTQNLRDSVWGKGAVGCLHKV
jgi:hypothetical protein